MIYLCKKQMYDAIALVVSKKDLKTKELTLDGFMCRYFEEQLCLPKNSITKIELK